jgi:hypothetical protein
VTTEETTLADLAALGDAATALLDQITEQLASVASPR